jgi:hypothetical protein
MGSIAVAIRHGSEDPRLCNGRLILLSSPSLSAWHKFQPSSRPKTMSSPLSQLEILIQRYSHQERHHPFLTSCSPFCTYPQGDSHTAPVLMRAHSMAHGIVDERGGNHNRRRHSIWHPYYLCKALRHSMVLLQVFRLPGGRDKG